ncbi:MAG: hypothetical protein QXE31_02215 [Candidatus Woesearchaeota archaeon]
MKISQKNKKIKNTLSEKELKFISFLELKNQYFFNREDIKNFFNSSNEMNVYIHRLKKKGRLIKLNKSKYYLIPIKAIENKWSEHPFILIDEIMNGKDYCIVGKAALYYWKLIEQIPYEYEIYNTRIHKELFIFNTKLKFIKRRKKNLPDYVIKKINNHPFKIIRKEMAEKWL